MKKYRAILLVFFALMLASCATPKIHLNSGDMTMEVTSKVPAVGAVDYAPDGKKIISAGWGDIVRLWDLTGAREAMKFRNNKGFIMDVAFSPDGKMIAATSGGFTQTTSLWDTASGMKLRDLPIGGGGKLSFSSDGKYIVVNTRGFSGEAVRIHDVQTGNVIKELTGHDFLQAEGRISPDGRYVVVSGLENIGNAVFATYAGSVSLLDAATSKEVWRTKFGLNAVVGATAFSPDGKHILVAQNDKKNMGADLTTSFTLFDTATGNQVKEFGRTTISSGMFSVGFVFHMIHALEFSPDGKFAMSGDLGGHYKLWDISTGTMLRQMKMVDETAGTILNVVPSVAFSPDGRIAVVASLASTRLFDVSTGDELATFIGFEDGEWLVTTPNGYYNASEKGDQYLSLKVKGADYTIAQLRESFYRPDLVKVALAGGSLKEFRKMADVKPPPSVVIVDTIKATEADEAKVTLKITDIGGGVGDIRLYLNGSAVVLDNSRGVAIVPKSDGSIYKTYNVRLTGGVNAIRVIAFNVDNSMQSADALHEITASFKTNAKPSLYAVVIGINEYKNPKLLLNYAVADAGLFSDSLQAGATGLFDKVVIKRLVTKEETTSENITAELKKMQTLNPDDLFVFYVASHGAVDDGEYFLITSNVGSTSTAKLKTDAISQTALKGLVANIPTAKKLIVIDTCNAGALGDAIQTAMLTRGMSEDTAMKVLSRAVGSTILSAATGVQEALEGFNGHGLFTYVLSQGISGKADSDKDGFIKTTELANYVDDEVPTLAERIFKKAQYPTVAPSGQAFPIGKVK